MRNIFSACWSLEDCLFFSLEPEPVSVSSGTEQEQGLWHLPQVTFNQDYTLLPWQTSLAWAKKVVLTSLLIVPGFIFMVCTGTGVLMNFTFYYSKTLSRTHKPRKCYTSPRTFKDTGTVVQSTYSSWPSERLGSWLVAAAQGRPTPYKSKEGAFMIINLDKYSKISLVSSDMLALGYKNQKRIWMARL